MTSFRVYSLIAALALSFIPSLSLAQAQADPQPAADATRAALERTAGGMIAKVLCSDVFLSHRTEKDILENDLTWLPLLPSHVDGQAKTVRVDTSTGPREAVFRPGLGCTLVYGKPLAPMPRVTTKPAADMPVTTDRAIQATVDRWMEEPQPDLLHRRGTRAVIVMRDGAIVAEAYGQGFNRDMPLPGYSMTKTVGMLLAGVLVQRGWLARDTDHLNPAWSRQGDTRGRITLDDLLRMKDGLLWDEDYQHPEADVFAMLAAVPDAAAFAASKPVRPAGKGVGETGKPGDFWQYSSGSYAILGAVMQAVVSQHHGDPRAFPRQALFDPLGMASAVVEPDASGVPQWPAFMYATARDWVKIGQLMLQRGRWNGQRILSDDWIAYAIRATPEAAREGVGYGAGVWLPTKESFGDILPEGSYYMRGFEEQYMFVIPSRHMVILRLGLTRPAENFDVRRFVADILQTKS
ncbi:beta-lactamase family protein [Xanthomonas citri pv. mangiferaeindicae LMG 941]|uniref:serine hydrolase domain-containing protein n=1 Tax=Xanthomonas citri TaxID=346 RepID=UPI0002552AE4|nr:serine hydrolase [Xanthomonas citri]CCG36479.1 beta-lactamase family protein [Xanthomonas citri pv. mangiferaeindicae LMG 941]